MGGKRDSAWLSPIVKPKKLSGNQNRQNKLKREADHEQYRASMRKFLNKKIPEQEDGSNPASVANTNTTSTSDSMSDVIVTSENTITLSVVNSGTPFVVTLSSQLTNNLSSDSLENPVIISIDEEAKQNPDVLPSFNLISEPHDDIDPSDPATWPLSLSSIRSWIQNQEPQQLHLPHYEAIKGRRFSSAHFTFKTPDGKIQERKWLLYSKITNSLYCFSCCTFSTCNVVPWGNYGKGKVGFQSYHDLTRGIKNHESDERHRRYFKQWIAFRNRHQSARNLNRLHDDNIQQEIGIWTDILKGIFEVVKFLAENNLPFRGSSTSIHAEDGGLFLNLIKFVAQFHEPLNEHLNRLKKKSVSYLSPDSQNEFIFMLGKEIRNNILNSIKHRVYFAIMFDSTPDSSKKTQTSQCVRSVSCSKECCYIEENFIDFINTQVKTGVNLADSYLHKLTSDKIDMGNCRGQSFDNEPKMSGEYNGVQKSIRDRYPLVDYVPCAAHSLNLIGKNVCANVGEADRTMGRIQNVYNFFAASPDRWSVVMKVVHISLKTQKEIRWSNRWDAVNPLYEQFGEIVECLKSITANPDKFNSDTVSGAESQLSSINNFRFLLTLKVWHSVLGEMERCSKGLQRVALDIQRASTLVQGLLNWLKEFRSSGWIPCLKDCVSKASKMGLSFSGGFSNNRSIREAKSRYKIFEISYFNVIVDSLISEFGSRFKKMHEISELFSFLWGTNLENYDEEQMRDKVKSLVAKYPNDLAYTPFCAEVRSLKSYLFPFIPPGGIIANINPLDILNILHQQDLVAMFPNTEIALRIFLTLPVTVASNERSFSKLKLIKNFLRSSMTQERLTNLAIISIEKELANKLNFDDFIVTFSTAKVRKIKLM